MNDPYLQLLRGYVFLEKAQYQNARASFSQAQSTFSHPHYNKLINPMFKVIEDIAFVKNYNKNSILFSPLPEAPITKGIRSVILVHDLLPLRIKCSLPLSLYHYFYV